MGVKSSLSQSPQVIVPPAPLKKAEMVLQMFLASLFLELFTSYVCVSLPMRAHQGDGACQLAGRHGTSFACTSYTPHSCVLVGESMTHSTRLGR